LANAELYTSARQLATHLAAALESRGVIEQAKGILMATQGCGPDEAFDILRRASQRQNRKLRLIAENIVSRSGRKGAP
jgi:AmiR/NasT family two-component response regulator